MHPAQKPVMLLQRLVLMSSNEGDLVLDPFCGSGTTAVACLTTGREYICFEKDKRWYDYSADRVARFNPVDYPEYNLWNDARIAEFVKRNEKQATTSRELAKKQDSLYD